MASVNMTDFDPALKQLYRSSNVAELVYSRRPMFATIPKHEGFGGRNQPVVCLYSNAQGRSASFSTAKDNATSVKLEDFLLTRVNSYSYATMDGETIEASKGDKFAFLSAMKTQIDSAMNALADDIESSLPRDGKGSIAVLGSISTLDFTLDDINDVTNFEVGMKIVFSDDLAGQLRSDTAVSVLAVNRTDGIISVSGAGSAVVGDFIYIEGDTNATAAGAADKRLKISGFDAWIPTTAPTNTDSPRDSFFGVDRSADSRLYGLHNNAGASTDGLDEILINSQSMAAREGGAPDTCFMNHVQVRKLIKLLGAKKEYTEVLAQTVKGQQASIGFRGVLLQGDRDIIKVVAANKCPSSTAYMLEMKTWQLSSLGPATKFLMEDNLRILRTSDEDGYEVRLGFRGNVLCRAPVYNVKVTLP